MKKQWYCSAILFPGYWCSRISLVSKSLISSVLLIAVALRLVCVWHALYSAWICLFLCPQHTKYIRGINFAFSVTVRLCVYWFLSKISRKLLRILKFGTKIGFDKLYCVKKNQPHIAYQSFYLSYKIQPTLVKKITRVPIKDSSAWVSAQFAQSSLLAWLKLSKVLPTKCTVKTLIRLSRWPCWSQWSDSSLDLKPKLLNLSHSSSYVFCRRSEM